MSVTLNLELPMYRKLENSSWSKIPDLFVYMEYIGGKYNANLMKFQN